MASISDLPPETILLIFTFYLRTESQKALICNISRVCLYWKELCMSNMLWIKFDGTLSFKELMYLYKKGCLNNTKELNISQTENINCDVAQISFCNLKNLEVIKISSVTKISIKMLSIIATDCFKLKEVHIESLRIKINVKLSYNLLGSFFVLRGPILTTIRISHCTISNLRLIFRCIADCCPNLEHLLLRNILGTSTSFPTEYFQERCSKLRILHLDCSVMISDKKYSLGFPSLEVFTYTDGEFNMLTDKKFGSVVFNSPNLKFLNLTFCDVSSEALCTIPASSVEYLYIAKSKVANEKDLSNVFKKWCHSLKEVDTSYSRSCSINKAIWKLVMSPAKSQLENLNLNFTQILPSVVENVLKGCAELEVLSLQGCRNLGRGMKKTYTGKSELNILRKKLQTFISDNPSEKCTFTLD